MFGQVGRLLQCMCSDSTAATCMKMCKFQQRNQCKAWHCTIQLRFVIVAICCCLSSFDMELQLPCQTVAGAKPYLTLTTMSI